MLKSWGREFFVCLFVRMFIHRLWGQGIGGNVAQTRYTALGASGDTMIIPMKIKLVNI